MASVAGHESFMREALRLATVAESQGEVPVGAVVVRDNRIIGEGFNCPISTHDPSAHAEIVALRSAARFVENYRLADCDLYVTIEPCSMCAAAAVHARIRTIYFGATEPKAGALQSMQQFLSLPFLNHRVAFEGGILEGECGALMQDFFKKKRSLSDRQG